MSQHISMTFKPTGNKCALLLVRSGMWFETVCHVQQSVRRIAKAHVERISGSEWGFEHLTKCENYGRFSRWPFFASLVAAVLYSSILPWTSRGSGCSLAPCSLFLHQSPSFFFLAHITVLLSFWCCDNETASAAYLGCLFTSHTLNCIPKWDRSWGYIPPTENALCKISSLTLRCLAIKFLCKTTVGLLSKIENFDRKSQNTRTANTFNYSVSLLHVGQKN